MTPAGEARMIALLEALVEASRPRPALMTPEETAHELGICSRTLERQVQLGKLPKPIKIGGQNRWRRTDVDQFLREAKQ